MGKKLKDADNNQWASLPEEYFEGCCCHKDNKKSATDNQWTSTCKNCVETNNSHK